MTSKNPKKQRSQIVFFLNIMQHPEDQCIGSLPGTITQDITNLKILICSSCDHLTQITSQ